MVRQSALMQEGALQTPLRNRAGQVRLGILRFTASDALDMVKVIVVGVENM